MACIYLRVPHYVASYMRNQDREHPVEPGGELRLNRSMQVWVEFTEGLRPNAYNRVGRAYCFSQKQWSLMDAGLSPTEHTLRKKRSSSYRRDPDYYLNDHDVHKLSGLHIPRGDDSGEYICLRIPKEAMRYGKLVPTNSCWVLDDSAANSVRSLLADDFWRAMYAYADRMMDMCNSSGRKFVQVNMLNSFMERYNIYCSADKHELEALKRNFNRRRKCYRFSSEDYVEFGE